MREKPIVILVGTFDTKPGIFDELYQSLESEKWEIVGVNTGTFGSKVNFDVQFEAEEVAQVGGKSLTQLLTDKSRTQSIETMGKGSRIICENLVQNKQVVGVISAGGGGGTFMAMQAMQSIPYGIPKVCISTLAARDLSAQMGAKDIVLVPSIVDVSNLNSLIKPILNRSARMLEAMIDDYLKEKEAEEKTHKVAISMFGNTTPCVENCLKLLEQKGIEVFTFHATGVGGRTMESLITEGLFDGVLDITTTELADLLCGGVLDAGPERLDAALETGIPQVIVPGCLDMVNFTYRDQVPGQYRERNLYQWSPDVTLMRTNVDENKRLGQWIMQKLNKTRRPLYLLIPLKGISEIDRERSSFYDREANQALFEALKNNIETDLIEYIEVDHHINDPEFAEKVVTCYFRLVQTIR